HHHPAVGASQRGAQPRPIDLPLRARWPRGHRLRRPFVRTAGTRGSSRMTQPKRGLGRGLDALFGASAPPVVEPPPATQAAPPEQPSSPSPADVATRVPQADQPPQQPPAYRAPQPQPEAEAEYEEPASPPPTPLREQPP